MTKKKNTSLDFLINTNHEITRFETIEKELVKLLGPSGRQPDRKWFKKFMEREMTQTEANKYGGNTTVYFHEYYVRMYFRNEQDASFVRLKFQ